MINIIHIIIWFFSEHLIAMHSSLGSMEDLSSFSPALKYMMQFYKLKLHYSQTIVGMRQYQISCIFLKFKCVPTTTLRYQFSWHLHWIWYGVYFIPRQIQHNTKLLFSQYEKYSITLIHDYITLENKKVIKVSFSTRVVFQSGPSY